jgi:hypothetical protein
VKDDCKSDEKGKYYHENKRDSLLSIYVLFQQQDERTIYPRQ